MKIVYSLFGLLAIFSLIAVAPPAFAVHATVEVDMAVGSNLVGCETTNECYIPHMVTIDVGGEVMWNNIDGFAHTVSAGTPQKDLAMILIAVWWVQAQCFLINLQKQEHTTTFAWFIHGWWEV